MELVEILSLAMMESKGSAAVLCGLYVSHEGVAVHDVFPCGNVASYFVGAGFIPGFAGSEVSPFSAGPVFFSSVPAGSLMDISAAGGTGVEVCEPALESPKIKTIT